jgi:hypothetical protein
MHCNVFARTFAFATVSIAIAFGHNALATTDAGLRGHGEWKSNTDSAAIRGTWSVTLSRTENVVEGTMTLTGSNVLGKGKVTGTISGNQIVLGVVSKSDTEIEFMGELRDGRVSGSWQLPAVNDGGTWSGQLTPVGAGKRTD